MRAGHANGMMSAQKKHTGVVFNPQRSHWSYQNGEWIEKECPGTQVHDGSRGAEEECERETVPELGGSQRDEQPTDQREVVVATTSNSVSVSNMEGVEETEVLIPNSGGDITHAGEVKGGNEQGGRTSMMVDSDLEHILREQGVQQFQQPALEVANNGLLLTQVDQVSMATKQKGIRKQLRRVQKPLRSPSNRRQDLKGISINLGNIKYQGKRKSTEVDVAMDNVEEEGHEMKRNKLGAEGEGSIPYRTPGSK